MWFMNSLYMFLVIHKERARILSIASFLCSRPPPHMLQRLYDTLVAPVLGPRKAPAVRDTVLHAPGDVQHEILQHLLHTQEGNALMLTSKAFAGIMSASYEKVFWAALDTCRHRIQQWDPLTEASNAAYLVAPLREVMRAGNGQLTPMWFARRLHGRFTATSVEERELWKTRERSLVLSSNESWVHTTWWTLALALAEGFQDNPHAISPDRGLNALHLFERVFLYWRIYEPDQREVLLWSLFITVDIQQRFSDIAHNNPSALPVARDYIRKFPHLRRLPARILARTWRPQEGEDVSDSRLYITLTKFWWHDLSVGLWGDDTDKRNALFGTIYRAHHPHVPFVPTIETYEHPLLHTFLTHWRKSDDILQIAVPSLDSFLSSLPVPPSSSSAPHVHADALLKPYTLHAWPTLFTAWYYLGSILLWPPSSPQVVEDLQDRLATVFLVESEEELQQVHQGLDQLPPHFLYLDFIMANFLVRLPAHRPSALLAHNLNLLGLLTNRRELRDLHATLARDGQPILQDVDAARRRVFPRQVWTLMSRADGDQGEDES